MNIPGISKIEYIEERFITLPKIYNPDTPISIDGANTVNWNVLGAFPGTVSMVSNEKESTSGQSFNIGVAGFVPKLNTPNRQLLTRLSQRKHVYRLTDITGQQYLIGNNEFFARLKYNTSNDPQPTGKRGYTFSISLTSPYDIVFLQ